MKPKITLHRIALKDTYTIGRLYIDGVRVCDCLEDKVRWAKGATPVASQKIKGETAIPYGIYPVSWTFSQRFQKYTLEVKNVPLFEGIRIHAGNTAKDTEGCLLPGYNSQVGMVVSSRSCVDAIEQKLGVFGQKKTINDVCTLEII